MTKNTEVAVAQRNNTLPMVRTEETGRIVTPFADIYETPDAYVLMVDLPGATKDSISLSIEKGVLSVKAVVASFHKENATMLFRELHPTTFHRVFNLGEGIDLTSVDAHYEHGVLTVKLYKTEQVRPKEIQIK